MGQPLLIIASLLSIVSELNGQLDEVDVGDSPVPGWDERLDQLAFDYRMSLDYLKGYSNLFCTRDSQSDSYPEIGWARSASWSCAGTSSWRPVWHDDMAYCHPLNRTDRV